MSSQFILTLLENHILINSFILIVFCIQLSHSSPTISRDKRNVRSDRDAVLYLQRFGYINESIVNTRTGNTSGNSYLNSVLEFQKFAGLNQTGLLDNETIGIMNSPRCGNRDKVGHTGDPKRLKRYALQGSEWEPTHLTYRISEYPTEYLTNTQVVDGVIAKAFKMWSEVTPLSFEAKKEGRVHIVISFYSYEHEDCDPFDGPGYELAHAYFPQYGGTAHFDNEEHWTISSNEGFNLLQVAVHEFGHSLGLRHSSVEESIMYPFYSEYIPELSLHGDDILAIQELYGAKGTSCDLTPEDTEPSANGPDLCVSSSVDAVTRICDSTFLFKGLYYWKIETNGLAEGYPRKISTDWDGLSGNLDAVLTWPEGKTFFFKDIWYWSFENMQMDLGYPQTISDGFPGIPNKIDAAFVWSGNGKTYFFKGNQYWRYDRNSDPPVSKEYPLPIQLWNGLPDNIWAAFRWENGMSYFFNGTHYFRYNDIDNEVDTKAKPPYPRPIAQWWFNCVVR